MQCLARRPRSEMGFYLFSSTIHDDNIFVWLVPPISRVLLNLQKDIKSKAKRWKCSLKCQECSNAKEEETHRSHHIHSLHNFSKHHMSAVKPRSLFHLKRTRWREKSMLGWQQDAVPLWRMRKQVFGICGLLP